MRGGSIESNKIDRFINHIKINGIQEVNGYTYWVNQHNGLCMQPTEHYTAKNNTQKMCFSLGEVVKMRGGLSVSDITSIFYEDNEFTIVSLYTNKKTLTFQNTVKRSQFSIDEVYEVAGGAGGAGGTEGTEETEGTEGTEGTVGAVGAVGTEGIEGIVGTVVGADEVKYTKKFIREKIIEYLDRIPLLCVLQNGYVSGGKRSIGRRKKSIQKRKH